jgi:hypothetical protein
MPITVKYGKLYMKDSTGSLVQILPETASSISNYQGATASATGVAGLVPPAQSSQKDKFLKGDGTWTAVQTAKEVKIVDVEPSASNTALVDNESFIFYDEGSSPSEMMSPVFTSGSQTISGTKKFVSGIYGGVAAMGSGSVFDLSQGACFTKTINANVTFSFSNVPANACCCITVMLTNAGNYVITWPSSVKWTGNQTPALTQNGKDVLTFVTCDGGTTWFGTTTCIGVTA